MVNRGLLLLGVILLCCSVDFTYGYASPLPLPHPIPADLENFSTGKGKTNLSDLQQIYAKCNESFIIMPGMFFEGLTECTLKNKMIFCL